MSRSHAQPTQVPFAWLPGRRSIGADRLVASSGVSPEVGRLVQDVVRRVGGTAAERSSLALELLGHFLASSERGVPDAEAIAAFGDPVQAANLLRRAVRRKRGFIWRTWWWASRGVAAAVAVLAIGYGWLASRFYFGTPTISVDYLGMIEARDPVPVDPTLHAGPIYSEVAALLEQAHPRAQPTIDETSEAWAATLAVLDQERAMIDRLIDAARRPSLGPRWAGPAATGGRSTDADPWATSLFRLELPHLRTLRSAARWLAAESVRAAATGDAKRATEAFDALVRTGNHAAGPFLVEQLVAQAISGLAAESLLGLLARHADRFDEPSLAALAASLDAIDPRVFRVDLSGERAGVLDAMQRSYTDDGAGDGHLVASSLGAMDLLGSSASSVRDPEVRLAAPIAVLVGRSRAEAFELAERTFAAAEAAAQLEPWSWTDVQRPEKTVDALPGGRSPDWMYDPTTSIGSYGRAIETAAMSRHWIDAVRAVVALHRWNALHGAWPSSLDQLVPEFLDRVPRDPYDGAALRYAVRDGGPVLWSIGVNRVDDGAPEADHVNTGFKLRWHAPTDQVPEDDRRLLDFVYWPRATAAAPAAETHP
jgi:hypothetical protein